MNWNCSFQWNDAWSHLVLYHPATTEKVHHNGAAGRLRKLEFTDLNLDADFMEAWKAGPKGGSKPKQGH